MGWLAPAMQVVGAAIAIKTASDQYEAGKNQKNLADESMRMAERNAIREEAETAERARRLSAQQLKEENLARASAAASGFATEGAGAESIALSLLEQQDENKRQLDWERVSGRSRAKIILEGGAFERQKGIYESQAMKSKALTTAGAGFANLATGAYDWWKVK